MTLEEEIMKLDLIASDAFEGGNKNEFRQLAEWLRELQRWREFGGRIANVCASYITEEQKEKLLEIMEVNVDEEGSGTE